MLRALVGSTLSGAEPLGFSPEDIRWVVEVDQKTGSADLRNFDKGEFRRAVPKRMDQSSGSKPSFLVGTAEYALGVKSAKKGPSSSRKHADFIAVLEKAVKATCDSEVTAILAFLRGNTDVGRATLQAARARIAPGDVVAFRVANDQFPFDKPALKEFWAAYLREEYSADRGECGICGSMRPTVRIVPFQVYLMGQRCPFSAFNIDKTAFSSRAKQQAANSPMCFDCVSKASQVLQYLLSHERHNRLLTRDESKGQGKSPLKNEVAVFWVKDPLPANVEGEELSIDVEALLVEALGRNGPPAPPPDPQQVRSLYGLPLSHYGSAVHLDQNRFYLAVLSPNKSRLVVREWIDESLDKVCERLKEFDAARTITTPDGVGEERVTIPEMLYALRPWKTTSAAPDAKQVRGLIRTAYGGTRAPAGLLEKAVQQFRVPDRAENRKEEGELSRRRMALAATIQLALRFETREECTLDTLNATRKSSAHQCGELLAVLEEAQGRSSRWRVNATLVDRFYGSASTAPGTILALLVKHATQAHFPKIRKEGRGYDDLSKQLEDVMKAIDETGGFPRTLTMREQGEFALGFYHKRATFRSQRPGQTPEKGQNK